MNSYKELKFKQKEQLLKQRELDLKIKETEQNRLKNVIEMYKNHQKIIVILLTVGAYSLVQIITNIDLSINSYNFFVFSFYMSFFLFLIAAIDNEYAYNHILRQLGVSISKKRVIKNVIIFLFIGVFIYVLVVYHLVEMTFLLDFLHFKSNPAN
ncbi:MAG: hypothetical protein WC667_01030 [Sulfurimonas sp.]|jgi:hypothetical protein